MSPPAKHTVALVTIPCAVVLFVLSCALPLAKYDGRTGTDAKLTYFELCAESSTRNICATVESTDFQCDSFEDTLKAGSAMSIAATLFTAFLFVMMLFRRCCAEKLTSCGAAFLWGSFTLAVITAIATTTIGFLIFFYEFCGTKIETSPRSSIGASAPCAAGGLFLLLVQAVMESAGSD